MMASNLSDLEPREATRAVVVTHDRTSIARHDLVSKLEKIGVCIDRQTTPHEKFALRILHGEVVIGLADDLRRVQLQVAREQSQQAGRPFFALPHATHEKGLPNAEWERLRQYAQAQARRAPPPPSSESRPLLSAVPPFPMPSDTAEARVEVIKAQAQRDALAKRVDALASELEKERARKAPPSSPPRAPVAVPSPPPAPAPRALDLPPAPPPPSTREAVAAHLEVLTETTSAPVEHAPPAHAPAEHASAIAIAELQGMIQGLQLQTARLTGIVLSLTNAPAVAPPIVALPVAAPVAALPAPAPAPPAPREWNDERRAAHDRDVARHSARARLGLKEKKIAQEIARVAKRERAKPPLAAPRAASREERTTIEEAERRLARMRAELAALDASAGAPARRSVKGKPVPKAGERLEDFIHRYLRTHAGSDRHQIVEGLPDLHADSIRTRLTAMEKSGRIRSVGGPRNKRYYAVGK